MLEMRAHAVVGPFMGTDRTVALDTPQFAALFAVKHLGYGDPHPAAGRSFFADVFITVHYTRIDSGRGMRKKTGRSGGAPLLLRAPLSCGSRKMLRSQRIPPPRRAPTTA